jgi:hypothetical protein
MSAARNPSQIRPAASVQAQVPLGANADGEQTPAATPEIPVEPHRPSSDRNIDNAAAPRESTQAIPAPPLAIPPIEREVLRIHTERAIAIERSQAHDVSPRQVREIDDRAPAALLGEEPVVAAPAPTITPVPSQGTAHEAVSRHAGAETTEVHVHIGRIEVITAADAPKPEKKPRAPRSALPLSEYLARRRQP